MKDLFINYTKKIAFIASIMLLFSAFSIGQENCNSKLKKAQKYFENGVIEEVLPLIKNCLESGFTKEERLEAYKLLVSCSLYEDNMPQAEEYMLKFLKINPEYELKKGVDGAEFAHLFNSFNTKPILSIGVNFGANISYIRVTEKYSLYDLNPSTIKYGNTGVGINGGITLKFHLNDFVNINMDAKFMQHKYNYQNTYDQNQISFIETQSRFSIPLYVSYNRFGTEKIRPFAEAGVSPTFLISANAQVSRSYLDNSHTKVPATTVDLMNYRNKFVLDFMIGAGVGYKLPKGKIVASVRYSFGVMNQTNSSTRYNNPEVIYKYHYIDPDFKLDKLGITVGYLYPIYRLKKK